MGFDAVFGDAGAGDVVVLEGGFGLGECAKGGDWGGFLGGGCLGGHCRGVGSVPCSVGLIADVMEGADGSCALQLWVWMANVMEGAVDV